MECKHCGQPMEDGDSLCKACGASANEEAMEETVEAAPAAKKRMAAWKIVLLVLGTVAVLGVLVWAVLYGLGVELRIPKNDIFYRTTYTVDDDKAAKKANVVIAKVGDETLTNSELQVYYWMTVVEYISNNYYYLNALGLDYTKPLSEQTCYLDKTMNWEQFFLNNAISVWHRYTTLNLMAKEEDHKMDAELQAFVDGIPESLKTTATAEGHDTVEELLHSELGAASTLEGYLSYWQEYYMGMSYFEELYKTIVPSAEEISAYYTENEATLNASGITKDMGRYVNVRHILVVPESAKENGSAYGITCPEDEWEACRIEAERILAEWKAGDATAESFGQLAKTYSTDPGSKDNGGLYTNVSPGYMVEEFDEWIMDENNPAGATGIVKTVHGYHVMYLDSVVGQVWEETVKKTIVDKRVDELVEQALARWPMEVNYKKIVLGYAELS